MFGAQNTGSPTHLISHTHDARLFLLRRTFDRMEPRYGASCGALCWPASRLCIASKWLLMLPGCVIERMSVNWLAIFAIRGCSSLMRTPGTLVCAGLYGPRISAGAS